MTDKLILIFLFSWTVSTVVPYFKNYFKMLTTLGGAVFKSWQDVVRTGWGKVWLDGVTVLCLLWWWYLSPGDSTMLFSGWLILITWLSHGCLLVSNWFVVVTWLSAGATLRCLCRPSSSDNRKYHPSTSWKIIQNKITVRPCNINQTIFSNVWVQLVFSRSFQTTEILLKYQLPKANELLSYILRGPAYLEPASSTNHQNQWNNFAILDCNLSKPYMHLKLPSRRGFIF